MTVQSSVTTRRRPALVLALLACMLAVCKAQGLGYCNVVSSLIGRLHCDHGWDTAAGIILSKITVYWSAT